MVTSRAELDDYHNSFVKEICCADCGYHRNGSHHPGIRCPKTGRCGFNFDLDTGELLAEHLKVDMKNKKPKT